MPRPPLVNQRHLRRTIGRLGVHQIDSVNVLVRAHYLPAYSRLGGYDFAMFDSVAWGKRSARRLFEYWGHEASLIPLELHPLFRWRMARADRGEFGWKGQRLFAHERRAEAEEVLARIRAEGPLAASDFEENKSRSGWWEWGTTKRALEWLFLAGHVTTHSRRGGFERVYDLTARVIPSEILDLPTPGEAEAQRALIEIAARALGIATEGELRDYFRIGPVDGRAAVAALVEEGVLHPVRIAGETRPNYVHRDARWPRKIEARALLAPFDPLIWERSRTERLFGFHYRIEIYVPAEKRKHGYYVLPFLLGATLVARVDLKADRQAGCLLVQSIALEPTAPDDTLEQLREELSVLVGWLGLGDITFRGT